MALIEDINQLRLDSLAALDASHDYYSHTKAAWRLAQKVGRRSRKFSIRNRATGGAIGKDELPKLAQRYIAEYLAPATFQHFVSLFEDFIFDFLRAWLIQYPESLSRKELRLQAVLDAADKAEIIRAVVDKELLGIAYDPIVEWFKYLDKIARLGCPNRDQIERLAEIKASRDVLVHNKGIASAIYVEKSLGRGRCGDGEVLEIPEYYHRESWQLIKQVISEVADAAITKL
jgi:hypothetical protein